MHPGHGTLAILRGQFAGTGFFGGPRPRIGTYFIDLASGEEPGSIYAEADWCMEEIC
jgi:hypothetical protein